MKHACAVTHPHSVSTQLKLSHSPRGHSSQTRSPRIRQQGTRQVNRRGPAGGEGRGSPHRNRGAQNVSARLFWLDYDLSMTQYSNVDRWWDL